MTVHAHRPIKTFSRELFGSALVQALAKLDPRVQVHNPVMFVTYVGALLTTLHLLLHSSESAGASWGFHVQITLWLWFTVLFANFAEAIAESRGKAQAQSLRSMRSDVMATKIVQGEESQVLAATLRTGDVVLCRPGNTIPADGEVMEGIAAVDESAITGESAPVIRESGGDRSAVTVGTTVLSDQLVIRVTAEPGESFLDRMIAMIEGAKRQKTPNEIALNIVLASLTIIFLVVVSALKFFADYSIEATGQDLAHIITIPVLVALLVCLIPTTISGLLSAVGIAGMDRLVRHNVIAKSGRAVEAAGDIDLLVLDKTGTITLGNRIATEFIPAHGSTEQTLAAAAGLSSVADETPEGRSIITLAKSLSDTDAFTLRKGEFRAEPFSAQTRMSGIDLLDASGEIVRSIRKGAVDAMRAYLTKNGGGFPRDLEQTVDRIARHGGTPLVVCEGKKTLGVVHLKDVIKTGIRDRFAELHRMGIRTLMVTGDNPLTAAAIAAEAGVDDFIAEATPEIKFARIREEQQAGCLVAMTGDGTNDAPALALADVAVAMNSGTQATREAGNMIDLDSNPTKLLEIVIIGKQLLMTRGALTTFSLANDIAKYFAIVPAMFAGLYVASGQSVGPLTVLNVMNLHSPQSAVLSAVIFNALIIVALIPLAIRGVRYQSMSASALLTRHIFRYGLGGFVAPFVGIKIIDLVLVASGVIA